MHRHAACAFSENGDVRRITAKSIGIGLHPAERRDLVEIAEVAAVPFSRQGRVRKEAETTQPIVQADQHHAVACEVLAGINRRRRAAVDEPATVDPDHHWQFGPRLRRCGFPDVDEKAVFRRRGSNRCRIGREWRLEAICPVSGGIAHRGPRRRRLRLAPAVIRYGRCSIRDAKEGRDAVCSLSAANWP